MHVSRNLESDDRTVSLSRVKGISIFNSDAGENRSGPKAEESYVRVKRSDLEKVLAIVERLERRIG
jgi:hypothetical protein